MRAHARRDSIHECIARWWEWPQSGVVMNALRVGGNGVDLE